MGRAHLKKCDLTRARQIRDGRDRLASLPGGDEIAFVAFKMPQKSAGSPSGVDPLAQRRPPLLVTTERLS